MPEIIAISIAAELLLRRRLAGERIEPTDDNRALYQELAEAGLMEPIHTLTRGRDGHYRLTELAVTSASRLASSDTSPAPGR